MISIYMGFHPMSRSEIVSSPCVKQAVFVDLSFYYSDCQEDILLNRCALYMIIGSCPERDFSDLENLSCVQIAITPNSLSFRSQIEHSRRRELPNYFDDTNAPMN